jgi:predicted dehydrogenase
MTMRVLVTGRGSVAQRHARHLREFRSDVVLGVFSHGKPGDVLAPFEWLPDWKSVLAWQPQAVIIASVSANHANELIACLDAGWPCLAEKPLVTTQTALAAVRTAVEKRALMAPVVVGCNLRYMPSLQRVREILRSGVLGGIVRAQFEVGQNLTQWRPSRDLRDSYSAQVVLGGGVLFDLVHEVDLARWLLGPLQVRAAIGGQFSQPLGAVGLCSDDVHVALLSLASGAPVTVSLDYVSQQLVRRHVFTGELGTLTWDLACRHCRIDGTQGVIELATGAEAFDMAQTYRAQMHDWLQAIDNPAHNVVSSLVDSLETTALMLAMKEAAT